MSDYLCAWSAHAFSTWAGPEAIVISHSRIDTAFAFPPQCSKPQKLPIDMCTHFLGLPLCCLPCLRLMWILGFLQKCFFVIWFAECPFQSCWWVSLYITLSLFHISRSCTSFAPPCLLSENCCFLSYNSKGAQWLLPSRAFQNVCLSCHRDHM